MTLLEGSNVLGGSEMLPGCRAAFEKWHACVSKMMAGGANPSNPETERAFAEFVQDHVSDDVLFDPPTYNGTYNGKLPFRVILSTVGQVFGPSFTYHRQWLSNDGKEWALEFTTEIADSGKRIRGIDLVSLNNEGLITSFRILAAPPSGVTVLKEEMFRRVPAAMEKAAKSML